MPKVKYDTEVDWNSVYQIRIRNNFGGELEIEEIVKDASKDGAVDAEVPLTYTVKCPTGITVNGKVYEGGPHAVDEDIYETLSTLDAPYQ